MDNTQDITCLSLCSGYGGLELGLRRVVPNLRTVAYVEVEAFACANLVAKMEEGLLDAAPVWTDIKTFNADPFRDRVHIVTAGYPCQPFSVAGKRKGTDDPRHLWPYIERIVQTVRPVWFFGENVPGHLALGYAEVYRSLRNLGYSVEAGLFTAAEIGTPHRRERLFVLAKSCRATSSNQDGQVDGRVGQENVSQGHRQTGSVRLGTTSELGNPAKSNERREQGCRLHTGPKTPIGWQANNNSTKRPSIWPARPGQPQYEWEEPRVVVHAVRRNCKRKKKQRNDKRQECCAKRQARTRNRFAKPSYRQAQSRLGRAVDGTAYSLDIAKGIKGGYMVRPGGKIGHWLIDEAQQRTDRLRLLGNGVVPQQAEKAFRELIKMFPVENEGAV